MAREACADPAEQGSEDSSPPQIDSRTLFAGARVLTIRHGQDRYTLRITRAEKLILTK